MDPDQGRHSHWLVMEMAWLAMVKPNLRCSYGDYHLRYLLGAVLSSSAAPRLMVVHIHLDVTLV